jgi:nicotinamide-nucleotide amidase
MDRSGIVLELAGHLQRRGWWLSCAESCTGGGIAAALTDVAGSSAWFDRGFVTYSNRAKREMLGVSAKTLETFGAVSRETVLEMVAGALAASAADLSVAVTGIAGPGGGTREKPVGTVWIAWATQQDANAVCEQFGGERAQVRAATVDAALTGLLRFAR